MDTGGGKLQSTLDAISISAQGLCRRIIFPESNDSRVQEAIQGVINEGSCQPVVLRSEEGLPEACEIFAEHPEYSHWHKLAKRQLLDLNPHKQWTSVDAENQLQNPLLLAALLVSVGYVDGGVAGSIATTAEVVRAGIRGIGLANGSTLVSSCFLMLHDYRVMTFGDCGVNPQPSAEQLASIAIDSANTHQILTSQKPSVALISFSTLGSAEHPDVVKVRQATAKVQDLMPSLNVCGELQVDAALIPDVAEEKAPESDVAGRANVLIFPDLSSGNSAYKLVERLGGCQAIGPILQGLACPWMDLSRGCKSDDIVVAAMIASVLSSTTN